MIIEIHERLLKRLKVYLGLSEDEFMPDNDEILKLMLTDAIYGVMDYCHVKKLSPPLESVAVQAAMRKFKDDNEGNLASIKMGEVAFSYENPINTGSFTDAERAILNAHRKVIIR